MTLIKRGDYHYGDNQADIRDELLRYSELSGYLAECFADAVCRCGAKVFRLALDDNQGVAVRSCVVCKIEHPIGDSDEYLEDAELGERACPCGQEKFEITVGLSLYDASEDVRWLYLGCRCPVCGLTGVYGDWKNEYLGYKTLLARI